MSVSFSHMIYYIEDIPRGLAFYREAFGLEPRLIHESGAYAELETGATALAFASEELGQMNLPEGFRPHRNGELPPGCELVLTTADVNGAYEKALAAGGVDVAGPSQKPWGQTVAYVRDPNGILIELASPMG